jgi:hypothetical protein
MAEEFKTLREVAHAVGGIRTQLRLMTAVYAASVVLGVGALKYFYDGLSRIAETSAATAATSAATVTALKGVQDALEGIRSDNGKAREDLGKIKGALKIASLGEPMPNAFEGFYGQKIVQPEKLGGIFEKASVGSDGMWVYTKDKGLIEEIISTQGNKK